MCKFKTHVKRFDIFILSYDTALKWNPHHLIDVISTLLPNMVQYHQAISWIIVDQDPWCYMVSRSHIEFSDSLLGSLGHGLTHWGRVMHICVGKLTSIGSDNGLSPERRQANIWTNAGMLLIWPLGTNFSEILIEIQTFSLKQIRLKMSSAKCCSFRFGLNVLNKNNGIYLPTHALTSMVV